MTTNKYNYFKVIQQNYGYGWEDNSFYKVNSKFMFKNSEDRALFVHDLKEYRLTGYATRTISRKVKIS